MSYIRLISIWALCSKESWTYDFTQLFGKSSIPLIFSSSICIGLHCSNSIAFCRYWPNKNIAFIVPGGQFNGQVTGWTQTSHPSNLILLPLHFQDPYRSHTRQTPTVLKCMLLEHKKRTRGREGERRKEIARSAGLLFLSRLALCFPGWACSVLQEGSFSACWLLTGLGHWWHLSPLQRQAGETALLALIPTIIIFKAAWIYITLLQAPVALQLPQEAAFLAFPSCLVGRGCHHGVNVCWALQKHLASWLDLFPESGCFITCTYCINISSSATQQTHAVSNSEISISAFTNYTLAFSEIFVEDTAIQITFKTTTIAVLTDIQSCHWKQVSRKILTLPNGPGNFIIWLW